MTYCISSEPLSNLPPERRRESWLGTVVAIASSRTATFFSVRARIERDDFLTDYTLADLEQRLGSAFIRPNRSELVNVELVERITSNGDGSATLTLLGGTTIHVTRRRAADVRRHLAS